MRSQAVKDIVFAEGAIAHLFERYGIDYCCHGYETLEMVCAKKGLDIDLVLKEIEALKLSRPYSFLHGDLWDEEFLIEYIVKNHHRYSRAMIPMLLGQLIHVNESHEDRFPYLKPVIFLFQRAARDFEQHMRKEEMILFPYFKSLASAREFSRRRPLAPFVTIDGPISRMEKEHEETDQIFAKIRALLSDFTIPKEASVMHSAVIKGLEAFTNDLHQHMHLENNMLFPRVLALEQSFDKRTGFPLEDHPAVRPKEVTSRFHHI
jgi:regulator of cell morphogenesis and NO signaling